MIVQKTYSIKTADVLDKKKRKYARYAVTKALKDGDLIKPSCCFLCKNESRYIEAHHVDYGKFLDVTWLCRQCHGLVHRTGHPLNPENNKQTPLPFIHSKYKTVNISFTVPIPVFLALQSTAEQEKKTVSKILREEISKTFYIEQQQLEFNFEGQNDNALQIQHA